MENFVIESEADKFLVLFENVFEEKHIEEENMTDYLDTEDGTFQGILEKIANKISEKIAIAASRNKSIKLLQLLNFFKKIIYNSSPCQEQEQQDGECQTIILIIDLLLQEQWWTIKTGRRSNF